MFCSGTTTKRFLQVIGNVCSYENTFPISHLWSRAPLIVEFDPANTEQVCKPNSVSRLVGMAIIHLVQPLPTGSSDLPGGRIPIYRDSGGQPFLTPPYLVLHREEFAWPRMSPRAPVRSYIKPP
jgi:hypothetical protein